MSVAEANTLPFISNISPSKLPIDSSARALAEGVLESAILPTTRVEAWKYTRVAKLAKIAFNNTPQTVASIVGMQVIDSPNTLVFVNGQFAPSLSGSAFPAGVLAQPLSTLDSVSSDFTADMDLFSAMNLVYLNDGIRITIAKNAVVDAPIQIVHILKGEEQLANFKVQIEAGDFSKATIVQGYFCEDATNSFANVTSEIRVGTNAHLTIETMQNETAGNYHISTSEVSQGKDSTFTINTMTLDGGLVRNNLNIAVVGENCTTNLNGAYLLKGKQHVDNHTVVDHKVPNCNSNELYKGVIDENATAVFNGKVFVRKDAQKINAFQSNRNVLLSDSATANSKPELEIYADDVKCSHGSTTGQLDDDAIYYLRARGLSRNAATQLLVSAFIGEVIAKIELTEVKAFVFARLKERFGWDINPEDFD